MSSKRKDRGSKPAKGSFIKKQKPITAGGAPSAPVLAHREPRLYTVSVAVPGSIIMNAQSPELQTYVAGEIARAAAVFEVDEIIVFEDFTGASHAKRFDPNAFLARILQYVETPQYVTMN